jgi:Fic family protein
MQVVSGPIGKERVHYEAPAANRLPQEMDRFLEWFNAPHPAPTVDPVLRTALAHLWFVTIHPLEDGNGRIARAISDMILARFEGERQRFVSMSAQIHRERGDYYSTIERTQKGDLDITPWMSWFIGCFDRALQRADSVIERVLAKARFWDSLAHTPINERQRKVLNLLLDGFQGKLTTEKWAKITKTSHDTALRDIQGLLAHGVLTKDAAGGRSTSYSLVEARPG